MTTSDLQRWLSLVDRETDGRPDRLRVAAPDAPPIEPLYTEAVELTVPQRASACLVGTIVAVGPDSIRHIEADASGGADFCLLVARAGAPPMPDDVRTAVAAAQSHGLQVGWAGSPDIARVLVGLPDVAAGMDASAAITMGPGELAECCANDRPAATFVVDGGAAYESGGNEVHALGSAVAQMWSLVRTGSDQGVRPADILHAADYRLRAGRNFVLTVAMLRAMRLLHARVCEAAGAAAGAARIEVLSSRRDFTVLDPWSNLIRGTVGAAAAMIGGADRVIVLPGDEPATAAGGPSDLMRRAARNTLLVARHEARLDWVTNPADGSWAFDALTARMASMAWELASAIDDAGGAFSDAGRALLQARIDVVRTVRAKGIGSRAWSIIGANEYASAASSVEFDGAAFDLPGTTDDHGWLTLRQRALGVGSSAAVTLLLLDEPSTMRVRLDWVHGLLACAGLAAEPCTLADLESEHPPAVRPAVVLVGPDAAWTHVGRAVESVHAVRGPAHVALAGRPAETAPFTEAGVDAFIHVGAPLLTLLETMVTRCTEVSA